MACCPSARTLTQKRPAATTAATLAEVRPPKNTTSGGSSETDAKLPTVIPANPADPSAGTTETVGGTPLSTLRKCLGSKDDEAYGVGTAVMVCLRLRVVRWGDGTRKAHAGTWTNRTGQFVATVNRVLRPPVTGCATRTAPSSWPADTSDPP